MLERHAAVRAAIRRAAMQISFVRTQGRPDRVYVQRTHGGEVSWAFPSFGEGLPHDLVHLVVESLFEVRQGFWGRVDAGVDPGRVSEIANRVGGPNKYAAFGADLRELYVAEALAGIAWGLPEWTDEDRHRSVVEALAKMAVEVPASVTIDGITAASLKLGAVRSQWRSLAPSGTLRVIYDPAFPARGFTCEVATANKSKR
jgi:hypothetical protein